MSTGVAVAMDELTEPVTPDPHVYMYAPTPLAGWAASVLVPPRHIGPSFESVAVGAALTLTVVVYAIPELQPDAVSETVIEYTGAPVAAGMAVASESEEEAMPGPLQTKVWIPVPPDDEAERLTVPFTHTGPSLTTVAVGLGFTVTTTVVYIGVQPEADVPLVTAKV